jgi:hypothetical protein
VNREPALPKARFSATAPPLVSRRLKLPAVAEPVGEVTEVGLAVAGRPVEVRERARFDVCRVGGAEHATTARPASST